MKWLRLQWDRVAAWAFVVLGVVLLIAGWYGVSGNAYPAAQLPYIASYGIGGVLAIAVGATLWLSADLRDEWRKLDKIDERLKRLEALKTAGNQTDGAHSSSTSQAREDREGATPKGPASVNGGSAAVGAVDWSAAGRKADGFGE